MKDTQNTSIREKIEEILRGLLEAHGVDVYDEYWSACYPEAETIESLIQQEIRQTQATTRLSERTWAYKNMRDHGGDEAWVELAKSRLERAKEELQKEGKL